MYVLCYLYVNFNALRPTSEHRSAFLSAALKISLEGTLVGGIGMRRDSPNVRRSLPECVG